MRIVTRAKDLQRMFLDASSEASAAFGNPSVYIKRYLTNVRHVRQPSSSAAKRHDNSYYTAIFGSAN